MVFRAIRSNTATIRHIVNVTAHDMQGVWRTGEQTDIDPPFVNSVCSQLKREELWDNYYVAAPRRQKRCVE